MYLLALYKVVRATTLCPSRINFPDDCMKEEVIVTVSGEEKLQAREEHDDRNPMNSTVPEKNEPKSDFFSFLDDELSVGKHLKESGGSVSTELKPPVNAYISQLLKRIDMKLPIYSSANRRRSSCTA